MQRLCQTAARLMHKCKKSAVTVLYIYGFLLILYLPFLAVMVVEAVSGRVTRLVNVAYDLTTAVVQGDTRVNIGNSSVGDKKSGHRWRDIRCSEETLFATSDWAKNISYT